jgi:hypothetical protein
MKNNPFTLKILDLNNNPHIVNCLGYQHTIKYIKFILSSDMNIYPDDIELYIGNKKLIDELKLYDYSINKDTKIKMYFVMKTGY